jgi:hypothetical protein
MWHMYMHHVCITLVAVLLVQKGHSARHTNSLLNYIKICHLNGTRVGGLDNIDI